MTLQMEPGTQRPMRPVQATFNMASGFAAPADPAPVDWTATGTRMTPVLDTKFMDDASKITVSGTNIALKAGIYEVGIQVHVVSTDAAAQDILFAITDFSGNTVHHASDAITVPAGEDLTYSAVALVNLATTGDGVVFRAAADVGVTLTVQPLHIGYVKKIGNAGEAGPA